MGSALEQMPELARDPRKPWLVVDDAGELRRNNLWIGNFLSSRRY
jgi:hypothetical protein